MQRAFTRTFIVCLALLPLLAGAQSSFYTNTPEAALKNNGQKRVIIPTRYRSLTLDTTALLRFLRTLPGEQTVANKSTAPIISLPMPDGSTARFHIWESSTMAPELSASYPSLRTFTGQGITDATATLKLDFTELGLHAQILSSITSAVYIDPYAQGALTACICYYKKDLLQKPFVEEAPLPLAGTNGREAAIQSEQCVGAQLHAYRLAVACTGEYAVAATGQASPTKAQALSAIVTVVNRVNGIYETELAIRMVLVAKEDTIVFVDSTADPFYYNNLPLTLINESQSVIDSRIFSSNYDMGHTFSTGPRGESNLGCVCTYGQKAKTESGGTIFTGDPYAIDWVAHEMGHALGANHTFNSITGDCLINIYNGTLTTNAEPGSGSTIMAYSGLCTTDNLQTHKDPQFHPISLNEISTYTTSGSGSTCGILTSTGNILPIVNAGANYIIPKSTPFILTGSATDANGDTLTYSWEEIDTGGPYGTWNMPSGNSPLFRSFAPVSTPTRYFPKLSDIINNTITIGEILPTYVRTLRFRLTARDNRAGGGGVCFDSTSLLVDSVAAPFNITAPTDSGMVWYINDFKTITWNASSTAAAPINCANVAIQLSTDGGFTFPITILASTPNDGNQQIQVPNVTSATCRIRVVALGNVFYNMSNSNFAIQAAPVPSFALNQPDTLFACFTSAPSATLRTSSLGGFTNAITFFTSSAPAGTTVSFGSNPVAPGSTTTVTLNGANTLPPGSYNVLVGASADSATSQLTTIIFVVGALPPRSLTTPAAYATGISTMPIFSWPAVRDAVSYTLELATTADFSSMVFTAGANANSFTPTTALAENTTYFWRITTNSTCGASAPSATGVFHTILSNCSAAFAQNFVNTSFPPANLSIYNPNNNVTWVRNAAGNSTIGSAFIDNYNNNTRGQVDDLRTQSYTPIGSTTDSIIISFDLAHKYYSTSVDDTLRVLVSADSGATFTTLYSKSGNALATANISTSAYVNPAVTDWRRERVALSSIFSNGGPLVFAIRNINNYGNNIFIDNLTICEPTKTPITYTFTGNGDWSNAANWNSIGKPPAILPANCEIVIDPIPSGQCLLDVTQRISTGAKLTVKSGKIIVIPGSVIVQ